MATVVTPQATNQSAICSKSLVKVPKRRTGLASRSEGTATHNSVGCTSMPAALRFTCRRLSGRPVFLLPPRVLALAVGRVLILEGLFFLGFISMVTVRIGPGG